MAKSHCRTLDDGLLNRLALKDDVMLSECVKLKPPRLALRIGLWPTGLWLVGWFQNAFLRDAYITECLRL